MTIIAQQKVTEVSNDSYELFDLVDMEDADGEVVSVKRSIGTYSIAQLDQDIASHQERIDASKAKKDAINAL